MLSALVVVASLAAVYAIARGLQREVHALSGELQRIADDDLDHEVNVDLRTAEFQSIGHMAEVFLEGGLRRREADQAAAEAAEAADQAQARAKEASEAEAAASAKAA